MCEIDKFINNKIQQAYFPGCVILVGNRDEIVFHKAYGFSELVPDKRRIKNNSIFDIASITKPLATATSILLLVDSENIDLNSPVGSILPEMQGTANEGKTIFELLTHTSGIPAWYPLYLHSSDEEEIIRFIGNMKSEKPTYSCLDYILLGKVLERVTGKSLKVFTEKNIFKPLAMKDTLFCPGQELRTRIASTEKGNKHERELSKKYSDNPFSEWREKTIVGEVHDGNSFYCFGGISGNAGLFSTASNLARFAQVILEGGNEIIKPVIVKQLLRKVTDQEGEKRSLGFIVGGTGCNGLSGKTAWHSGFTGCVFWVDPVKQVFIVFLSNAVHPKVKPNIITSIRPQIIKHCLKVAM